MNASYLSPHVVKLCCTRGLALCKSSRCRERLMDEVSFDMRSFDYLIGNIGTCGIVSQKLLSKFPSTLVPPLEGNFGENREET